ncbi:hypothetical protein ACFYOT_40125 [Saccharothrix saharensis]|uniref:hypothetical protein n=1 Tax=Saccharothrix saharensis TaxID=571190 RepID=UPI00367AC9F6
METPITDPGSSVFVLVAGDGDYAPLVQRLRQFGGQCGHRGQRQLAAGVGVLEIQVLGNPDRVGRT